jgi:hypothetical protein
MSTFEQRIARLDLSLFDAIDSQSDAGDRSSWLAFQRQVRRAHGSYAYLEIGSHLGGSIQPHLLDPQCRTIYSIDKRPLEPPDDRGQTFRYEGNSTARMLALLRALDPDHPELTGKIVCFDADARDIDPARITDPPDLCFIDGEHTRAAVLSDFAFCQRVCAPRAVICFHDDWILYPALAEILRSLKRQGIPVRALKLRGSTFAILLGTTALPDDPFLRAIAVDGRRFILRMRVRRIAKRLLPAPLLPVVRLLRRLFGGSPP